MEFIETSMSNINYLYDQPSLEWEEYQDFKALSEEYSCASSADFNQLLEEGYSKLETTQQLLDQTKARLEEVQSKKLTTPVPMTSAWKTILSSTSFWIHLCSITLLLSGVSYAYSYSGKSPSSQVQAAPVQPN